MRPVSEWIIAIAIALPLCWLAGRLDFLYGQQPTPALTPDQKVEYYRQGAALQYKQLLAANQRIAELEARIESDRLEKEATAALREMAEWRRRILGDARCTIEEPNAKVTCPLGAASPVSPDSLKNDPEN